MKKQLIMAAIGLAMAGGLATTSASAAPIAPGAGISDASTSLAEKVHYRRHYGHHHHRGDRGWRRWRPKMFGYLRHRHHHHRHHHQHHRRSYY